MERLTGHAQLQELLGAYALDAVDPEEAAAIERHLPTCPRCRNELADHREMAALLGHAGGAAPGGVWDRIVAGLEEPPPALTLTRPHTPPSIHARPAPPGQPGADSGQVIPIGRRRPHRTVSMRLLVAVASAAAVVVIALGIQVGRLESRPTSQTTNLAALAYRVADADPTARHLTLSSPDGVHTVRAVVIADGTTYLGPGNLDKLASDETYQMWGIVDGARVSLGVIGSNPTYHAFTTPSVAAVIAMTVEQRGGVVSSTKTPVVTAVVPGA